jgi:hypothetical protein
MWYLLIFIFILNSDQCDVRLPYDITIVFVFSRVTKLANFKKRTKSLLAKHAHAPILQLRVVQ